MVRYVVQELEEPGRILRSGAGYETLDELERALAHRHVDRPRKGEVMLVFEGEGEILSRKIEAEE